MKKYLMLIAAVMCFGGVAYSSDGRATPTSSGAGAIPADYGGVDYWGVTFSNDRSTVALPAAGLAASAQGPAGTYGSIASTTTPNTTDWVIYGAYFSSGTTNDFIEVAMSTGGFVAASSSNTIRFYNVANSTGGAGAFAQGIAQQRWPIHRVGNLFMKPSSTGYNQQGLLFYKDPDK